MLQKKKEETNVREDGSRKELKVRKERRRNGGGGRWR